MMSINNYSYNKLLIPGTNMLCDVQMNGMKIHRQRLQELKQEKLQQQEEKRQEIENYLREHGWTMDRYVNESTAKSRPDELNPSSPKQMMWCAENILHLDENVTTTDEEQLKTWKEEQNSTFAKLLLDHRGLSTKLRYIRNLEDHTQEDGKIYGNIYLWGVRTHRTRSSDPNLQNMEKEMIRQVIVPSDEHVLVEIDFSQVEARVTAIESDDETLKKLYREDIDLHDYMTEQVFNITREEVDTETFEKKRSIVKTIVYGCVTTDAVAVTPDGYKSYEEIEVGDEVLGYNQNKDQIEITKVKNKFYYENAETVHMNHDTFKATVTPNHRWFGDQRVMKNGERFYEDRVFETQEINSEHRIKVSAEANLRTEDDFNLTESEVRIIAWILTDGSTQFSEIEPSKSQGQNGERRAHAAKIHQKKEPYKSQIRDLTKNICTKEHHRFDGVVTFALSSPEVRDIWERSKLHDITLKEFVLNLSDEKRDAFLDVCYKAEGHQDEKGRYAISQVESDLSEAIRIAIFLNGNSVSNIKEELRTGNTINRLYYNKPIKGTQTMDFDESDKQDVWCIETELGSWVMKQHGQLMITGNSFYGKTEQGTAEAFNVSQQKAEEWQTALFDQMPDARDWLNEQAKKPLNTESSEPENPTTRFERRRRFPLVLSKNKKDVKREAKNFPIQSTASDLLLKSAINLWESDVNFEDYMLALVHDSILFEFPFGEWEDLSLQAGYIMEDTAQSMMDTNLPMPVDYDVSNNSWADVKEVDIEEFNF